MRKSKKKKASDDEKSTPTKEKGSVLLHPKTGILNYWLLLSYDLQYVHKTISDYETTTLELLQERNLSSNELLKNLEEVLNDINHAEKTAESALCNIPESASKTTKEAFLILSKMGLHIVHAYEDFFYRGSEVKDVALLYKRWLRAVNKATQYLSALEDLYASLLLEALIFNNQELKETTVRKFILNYCGYYDTKLINSWKNDIDNKAKDLIQPSTFGGDGKANKYLEYHLFTVWPRLRVVIDSLPEIKKHN